MDTKHHARMRPVSETAVPLVQTRARYQSIGSGTGGLETSSGEATLGGTREPIGCLQWKGRSSMDGGRTTRMGGCLGSW